MSTTNVTPSLIKTKQSRNLQIKDYRLKITMPELIITENNLDIMIKLILFDAQVALTLSQWCLTFSS